MRTILHLSIDYDNPHRGRPTRAIKDFIEDITFCSNIVISLRRVMDPRALQETPVLEAADPAHANIRVATLPYFGLPGGIGLYWSMRIVAAKVRAMLEREGIRPDLVHAHKMTFEGIAGRLLAEHWGARLFLSIRGEVEAKVLRYKPSYVPMLQKVCDRADRLYFVSAWFRGPMRRWLRFDEARTATLPNRVRNETPEIAVRPPTSGIIAVLNLNDWQRKGLGDLLKALVVLRKRGEAVTLDIVGAGSDAAVTAVAAEIARHDLATLVCMKGRVDNTALLERIHQYAALVLPSRNETFGMVYAEALFAGVPVIMNEGSGIDGYLDGIDVALYAIAGDVTDIANKISQMLRENSHYRRMIAEQSTTIFARFSASNAMMAYRADVEHALAAPARTA